MIDSFIPAELAVAPNPLGLAPNLKLTTIPVDAYTCFELWMPIANTALMRAEAMLLMGDYARVEEICAKLTWLLGAKLAHSQEPYHQRLIYDWRDLRQHLQETGHCFNAIAVNYQSQTIYATSHNSASNHNSATIWTWQPAYWQVQFLHLCPTGKGFTVDVLPISLAIAGSEAITKSEEPVRVASNRVVLT